jgi:two-component system, sensor histidine kinase and response regulator
MPKPIVLVVDDNPTVVDLICRMLRLDGTYEPVTALNGVEALERFEQAQPCCLILDVKMPELDGFLVLRALRGDQQSENVALVLLTALNDPTFERIGIFSGADVYLTKPFKLDDLLHAVNHAIKISPQQRLLRMELLEKQATYNESK